MSSYAATSYDVRASLEALLERGRFGPRDGEREELPPGIPPAERYLVGRAGLLALTEHVARRWEPKQLRLRLFAIAGTLARRSRQTWLRLSRTATWTPAATHRPAPAGRSPRYRLSRRRPSSQRPRRPGTTRQEPAPARPRRTCHTHSGQSPERGGTTRPAPTQQAIRERSGLTSDVIRVSTTTARPTLPIGTALSALQRDA